jgi:hypothetical protein
VTRAAKRVILTNYKVRIQVASKKRWVDYSAEIVRIWWEVGLEIRAPDPSFQENRMTKGRQRSNREQKKAQAIEVEVVCCPSVAVRRSADETGRSHFWEEEIAGEPPPFKRFCAPPPWRLYQAS